MGLLAWSKSILHGDENASLPASEAVVAEVGGTVLAGLDFMTAVDAHMKWKMRLEGCINGTRSEQLQVDVVCRDDQCPLGQWIHNKGAEMFGFSEAFSDLKVRHADFHRCAGDVLAAAQSGDTAGALKLLQRGNYVTESQRIKKLLARMFVIASEGDAIDAHIRWKARLRDYIQGFSKEDIKVDTMFRDDQCTLGQWLSGIGRERFGQMPAFSVVRSRHADFRRCAGEVLAVARHGAKERALHMLEEGAYRDASDQMVEAIATLFQEQSSAS
ncbi:MAG: CZB domain-containing protein [Sulfuritalea sp.]|nr:CZB domain-containing protein [Sulfuritalea sp.]